MAVTVFRAYREHLQLIEASVRKCHARGGMSWMDPAASLRTMSEVLREGEETGHFLLVAVLDSEGVGSRVVGYVWAEIQANGDCWLHHTYSEHPDASRELYRIVTGMANAAGCGRLTGYFWRTDRLSAYQRRWGVRVIGYVVARDLDGPGTAR